MASGSNATTLYGLWVEAVEEPIGVPEAWHEGKGENYLARMLLLKQQRWKWQRLSDQGNAQALLPLMI